MARSTQLKNIRIVDGSGDPRAGVAVELKRGAVSFTMAEVGNGYYENGAVDPGQYSVYVGAIDTSQTVAVGAGEVDRPDYSANPDSIMVTSPTGEPDWASSVSWAQISSTPTTISGYGITDAFTESAADAKYLPLTGGTLSGPLIVTGDVDAVNGDFSGDVEAVDGIFSGDVSGFRGDFTSTVSSDTNSTNFIANSVSATGSPLIRLNQNDVEKGFLQYRNANGAVRLVGNSGVPVEIWGENVQGVIVKSNRVQIFGASNFGRLASAPTANAGGDSYYNTTDNIGYQWNGSEWLQLTAGASYGQLGVMGNTTAQTGLSTTYQKITQYDTNGIEEGGVTVDLPSDEITLPAGIWEISFSHSMDTSSSNIVATFSVFSTSDTGFATPFLTRARKIGSGSDIGSMSGSRYVELASTTTIAIYCKVNTGTTNLTIQEGDFSVIRIK